MALLYYRLDEFLIRARARLSVKCHRPRVYPFITKSRAANITRLKYSRHVQRFARVHKTRELFPRRAVSKEPPLALRCPFTRTRVIRTKYRQKGKKGIRESNTAKKYVARRFNVCS